MSRRRADNEAQAIGRRIRAHRHALELSQETLAARLGVHQNSVSGWERGEQTLSIQRLVQIAAVLDVTIGALVDGDHTVGAGR